MDLEFISDVLVLMFGGYLMIQSVVSYFYYKDEQNYKPPKDLN